MASAQPASKLRPRLIALHGPDECGKDTIADIICGMIEGSQMTVVRKAFADAVKISIGAAFGVPEENAVTWYDQLKKGHVTAQVNLSGEGGKVLTGRSFIENYAESHKRLYGENFWVAQVLPEEHYWFQRKWRLPGAPPNFDSVTGAGFIPDFALITDLRYHVEYAALQYLGGEIWGIVGRGHEGNADVLPPKYVIDNSGSVDNLYPQIATLLDSP